MTDTKKPLTKRERATVRTALRIAIESELEYIESYRTAWGENGKRVIDKHWMPMVRKTRRFIKRMQALLDALSEARTT
jgi:hypothetical protein